MAEESSRSSHELLPTELIEQILEKGRRSKFEITEEIANAGSTLAEIEQARGEARGRELGAAKGMRRALVTVLTRKFGTIPSDVEAAVAGADIATLDTWLGVAATAAGLADVGIVGSTAPADSP